MRQFWKIAERKRRFEPSSLTPRAASISESRRRSSREQAAIALFGLHLIGSPLLLGGVFAWAMLAIACSALVCLIAAARSRPHLGVSTPIVFWTACVLLAWTALQATPLPCGFVRAIAPGAAEMASGAHAVLYGSPAAWCTLSYDPGATRQEVIKGIALVATFLSAWIVTAGRTRRDVFWYVAGSSLAMSCVAIAHAALRSEEVFGIYKPVFARAPLLLAPLLNANNLGAFAALGAPLWIGLTYRHARSEVRWWGRVAAVITTVVAILSLSRGAMAQVLATLLFMAGYLHIRSRRSRPTKQAVRWTSGLVVLGATAIALALVVYVAGGEIAHQFTSSDFDKLALVGRAFGFAAEHPWIGVGRGAFSAAFLSQGGPGVRFGYAENFVAQWSSEWGAPLTLLWIAVVSLALVRRLRTAKSIATIAAATALLGLCAQNLVDLGFELIGIATVAIALLGAILSPSELRTEDKERSALSLKLGVAVALAAGFAGLLAVGPKLHAGSLPELEKRLHAALDRTDRRGFRQTLQRAVTLHPGEPTFAILAATEGLRHNDPQTLRWLNRAMQLAPHWGAPHVLAHQWLWRRGHRRQALLELQLAAERDPNPSLIRIHYCQLAAVRGELALAAIPSGAHRRDVLEMTGGCVPHDSRSSEVIDAVILREFADSSAALERSAARVADSGEIDQALAMFGSLLKKAPTFDSARLARARVLQRAERYDELVRQVDRDLMQIGLAHRPGLIGMQADAYARLGDLEGMRQAIEGYRRLVGTTQDGLADTYALEGSLQLRLQNFGAALAAFHEAYRINGATQHLASLAHAARQLGNRSQVLWAYMQLCDREPSGTNYCAERDRLLAPSPL